MTGDGAKGRGRAGTEGQRDRQEGRRVDRDRGTGRRTDRDTGTDRDMGRQVQTERQEGRRTGRRTHGDAGTGRNRRTGRQRAAGAEPLARACAPSGAAQSPEGRCERQGRQPRVPRPDHRPLLHRERGLAHASPSAFPQSRACGAGSVSVLALQRSPSRPAPADAAPSPDRPLLTDPEPRPRRE